MKHRKFPAPQIAEAVFRGRKMPYNFEVYPINVEFNEVPAVYVISKRKIDRHGRAHHAIVCLGQTERLAVELKNHKKGKCVRQLKANTVSVLISENEKSRLAIEADLKAAHVIPCLHNPGENAAPPSKIVLKSKALKLAVKSETKLEKTPAKILKSAAPELRIVKKTDNSRLKSSSTKESKSPKSKMPAENLSKTKPAHAEALKVKTKLIEQKTKKSSRLQTDALLKTKAKTKAKTEIKPKTAKTKSSKTLPMQKAKINSPKSKKVQVSATEISKKSFNRKAKSSSAQILKAKNSKAKIERKVEAKSKTIKKISPKLNPKKVKGKTQNSIKIKVKPDKAKQIKKVKKQSIKPLIKTSKSNAAKAARNKVKTSPAKTNNALKPKTKNSPKPKTIKLILVKQKSKTKLNAKTKSNVKTARVKKPPGLVREIKVEKRKIPVKKTVSKARAA